MSRLKGGLPFSGTFEVQAAQPFDARMNVGLKEDLINPETWKALDGSDYVYPGLLTVVSGDTDENNGIYRLKQKPITEIDNWIKEGGGTTESDVTSVNTKTGAVILTTEDIKNSEDKNIDTLLGEKQDTLSNEQIADINTISAKANTNYVDEQLSLKQNNLTETQLNAIDNVENKADKTYVDEELNKKQDTLSVAQLTNIADVPNKQNTLIAGENIEIDPDTNVISSTAGITEINYDNAINKPQINNVTLEGNKTAEDLGIIIPDISNLATKDEVALKQDALSQSQLNSIDAVPAKANISYVEAELAKKQNTLTEVQLTNINNVPNKADTTFVNSQLANKQDLLSASQMAGIDDIPNKANTIYVNEQLATKQDKLVAGANISIDEETNTISSVGSGGTTDYTALENKPQINGVTLNGNKTTSDLGIVIPDVSGLATKEELNTKQNTLTAGDNITITDNTISSTNTIYDDTTVKADILALQNGKADKTEIPTATSDLTNDSDFVSDANYVHTDNNFTTVEKTKLEELENYNDTEIKADIATKQNLLVAGTGIEINPTTNEIKSTVTPTTDYEVLNNKPRINGQELLGDRPLAEFGIASTEALESKQDTLVSGENIKTINGESIVGAGTILIDSYDDTTIKANITALQNDKADKVNTYTKTEIDTALTDYALKTELPTNTSDLTNDSNFVVDANYVHTDYNFTQSAVSELLECTLFKNNYTPIIDTLVSDTESLSSSKADKENTYTKVEVDSKLSSVYKYKGTVENIEALEAIVNPAVGDVYDVLATGNNYAWNGTEWDKLAGIVDLSGYALKTEIPTNTSALTNDSNFVVDANYVHTDNNFTTEEKTKLAGLENFDATEINADIVALQNDKADKVNTYTKTEVDTTLEDYTLKTEIPVTSVNTKTGEVVITKADVGLDRVDNTPDISKPVSNSMANALNTKVDKVEGKDLSTNDFTTEEKTKLGELSKDAVGVNFDNTGLKMEATNVQDAVEELHVTFGKTFVGTQSAFALLPETEQQEYDTLIFVLE